MCRSQPNSLGAFVHIADRLPHSLAWLAISHLNRGSGLMQQGGVCTDKAEWGRGTRSLQNTCLIPDSALSIGPAFRKQQLHSNISWIMQPQRNAKSKQPLSLKTWIYKGCFSSDPQFLVRTAQILFDKSILYTCGLRTLIVKTQHENNSLLLVLR